MYPIRQTAKYAGIYRCTDKIHEFKIRVKIKEIIDIPTGTESKQKTRWEVKEFKWQQKVFNNFEKQYYGEEKNCLTETQKHYNLLLTNPANAPDDKMLFTYVDDDNFEYIRERASFIKNNFVRKETSGKITQEIEEFDYATFLQKAIVNEDNQDRYSVMYIMADMGQYEDEKWIKFEHVLCALKYNEDKKILQVYPDFSTDVPYFLQIDEDLFKNYYYYIENISDDIKDDLLSIENELLNQFQDCNFEEAEINQEQSHKDSLGVYIFLEIICGKNFEYNDFFVKYFVDLPEKWKCKTASLLSGMTQTCHAANDDEAVVFGHTVDLDLEYDIKDFVDVGYPAHPYIYFEVISRGSFNTSRCEGLAFYCLPITKPGCYNLDLPCYRFSSGSRGEMRRFFIGDCSSYNDIRWISFPKSIKGTVFNKYGVETISTGTLSIRMNVIHQSHAFLKKYNETDVIKNKEMFVFEKLKMSSLVKSIEQILVAFEEAREKMLKARNK